MKEFDMREALLLAELAQDTEKLWLAIKTYVDKWATLIDEVKGMPAEYRKPFVEAMQDLQEKLPKTFPKLQEMN